MRVKLPKLGVSGVGCTACGSVTGGFTLKRMKPNVGALPPRGIPFQGDEDGEYVMAAVSDEGDYVAEGDEGNYVASGDEGDYVLMPMRGRR